MNSAAVELAIAIGNNDWISEWEGLEKLAKSERGDELMIYNVTPTPGNFLAFMMPL